jgi:hypothetical protein
VDDRVDPASAGQETRKFIGGNQISQAPLSNVSPFPVVLAEFVDNDDVLTALIEFRRDV